MPALSQAHQAQRRAKSSPCPLAPQPVQIPHRGTDSKPANRYGKQVLSERTRHLQKGGRGVCQRERLVQPRWHSQGSLPEQPRGTEHGPERSLQASRQPMHSQVSSAFKGPWWEQAATPHKAGTRQHHSHGSADGVPSNHPARTAGAGFHMES